MPLRRRWGQPRDPQYQGPRNGLACRSRQNRMVDMPRDLFLKNGHLITMDPELGDQPATDIRVSDGRIARVGRNLATGDAEVIDVSGLVVIPGLIDTHRHLWQSTIRNSLPVHADAAIEGLKNSGVRAVFAHGAPNLPHADWWKQSTLEHPYDCVRIKSEHFATDDQLVTLAMALRGPEF